MEEYRLADYVAFIIGLLIVILLLKSAYNTDKKKKKSNWEKGKIYSQLKIYLITQDLKNEEDIYHLKGMIDGINYDIQVNRSDYDYRKQCYEYSLK